MPEDTFDFVSEDEQIDLPEEEDEIATSGNPELIHQGLTKEQVLDAQKRAGSPQGLVIAAFMREVNLPSLDVEELLKYKVT